MRMFFATSRVVLPVRNSDKRVIAQTKILCDITLSSRGVIQPTGAVGESFIKPRRRLLLRVRWLGIPSIHTHSFPQHRLASKSRWPKQLLAYHHPSADFGRSIVSANQPPATPWRSTVNAFFLNLQLRGKIQTNANMCLHVRAPESALKRFSRVVTSSKA